MPASRKIPKNNLTTSGCCDWQKSAEDLGARAQNFARQEPAQAVGLAFVAGLVLTVLPVGRLVAVLVRLAFALVRPALLILGAVRLCEAFEKRNQP